MPVDKSTPVNAYGQQLTDRQIECGVHREFVGGLWDLLGTLQFRFLLDNGLQPAHRFLDIGCGALRGGIHFVRYLDAGNYFGVDLNASLIKAAGKELEAAGLTGKHPTLAIDGHFDFLTLGATFDFALAHSVFTHLPLSSIDRCVTSTAKVLRPGGRLFATFFEAPRPHLLEPLSHVDGVVTYGDRDPFHYHFPTFEDLVSSLPFRVRNIGGWNHPRGQHMLEFERLG